MIDLPEEVLDLPWEDAWRSDESEADDAEARAALAGMAALIEQAARIVDPRAFDNAIGEGLPAIATARDRRRARARREAARVMLLREAQRCGLLGEAA